jgi:hypothetical protein
MAQSKPRRRRKVAKLAEEASQEHLHKPSPLPQQRLRLPVSTSAGGLAPEFSTLEEAVATADLVEDCRRAR